jgi:hypothetical protein
MSELTSGETRMLLFISFCQSYLLLGELVNVSPNAGWIVPVFP